MQVARVAEARKLPVDKVQGLVADNTNGRSLFGEPTLNVLPLNLALDATDGTQGPAAANVAQPKPALGAPAPATSAN